MTKEHGENITRQRIADVALQLFKQYGAKRITMDDIAEQLHMSKRTIYEHYSDKTELLSVCMERLLHSEREARQRLLSESGNVIEGIMRIMYRGINQMRVINPVLMFELERYYPAVWAIVVKFREENLYKESVQQVDSGIRQELFRADINVDIVAKLFLSQFEVLKDTELFPLDRYSRADLVQHLVVNFLRGISTERGRQLIDVYLERRGSQERKDD